MKIPKFNKNFKDIEQVHNDFLEGTISENKEYFRNDYYEVSFEKIIPFQIYLADFPKNDSGELKRTEAFIDSCNIIREHYFKYLKRDILLQGEFWYSLNLLYFRNEIIKLYPKVKSSSSNFKNVVLKKFDWENYIYKMVLAVQYIELHFSESKTKERYYRLIAENFDVYNYIIKYSVFRTDKFLINILDIIDEYDLSSLLKKAIKDKDGKDLGDDERYGRRVIYEFNKSYPVLLSPMMTKEELKEPFFEYLSYYYEGPELKKYYKKPLMKSITKKLGIL